MKTKGFAAYLAADLPAVFLFRPTRRLRRPGRDCLSIDASTRSCVGLTIGFLRELADRREVRAQQHTPFFRLRHRVACGRGRQAS